jgi:hypothetical protein
MRLIQQTPWTIPSACFVFFQFIRPTIIAHKWPTRFFTHFQNDGQKQEQNKKRNGCCCDFHALYAQHFPLTQELDVN